MLQPLRTADYELYSQTKGAFISLPCPVRRNCLQTSNLPYSEEGYYQTAIVDLRFHLP